MFSSQTTKNTSVPREALCDAVFIARAESLESAAEITAYLQNDFFNVRILTVAASISEEWQKSTIGRAIANAKVVVVIGCASIWPGDTIWLWLLAEAQRAGVFVVSVTLPNETPTHGILPIDATVSFQRSIHDFQALLGLAEFIARRSEHGSSIGLTNNLEKTIRAYNNETAATEYYDLWSKRLPLEHMDRFQRRLRRKAATLDAGCGPGHHATAFSKQGYQVVGVDLSDASLRIAKRSVSAVRFLKANIKRLRWCESHSFDGIWACASVVHTTKSELRTQLREFQRVLTPGGILSLTVSVRKRPHTELDGRYFESFRCPEELTPYLEQSGFELLSAEETLTRSTTLGGNRIGSWVTVVSRAWGS